MGDHGRKTELLVGLFLFIGMLLLGTLILRFSKIKDGFQDTYNLSVSFPDAGGLVSGSPVRLGGAKIGRLSDKPRLNDEFSGVIVDLEITDGFQIPEGSSFRIGTAGLMGDSLVDIEPAEGVSEGKYIQPDAVIVGAPATGLGALGDAAEELSLKTARILVEVESALGNLTGAIENLDAGFLGQENADNFNQTLKSLNGAISKIDKEVLAEANREQVTAMLADFGAAAEQLKEATENIKAASEKLDPVLEESSEAISEISDAASEAEALFRELREGDGLLPALLSDAEMKQDFKYLIRNLKERGVLWYKDLDGEIQEDRDNKFSPRLPTRR